METTQRSSYDASFRLKAIELAIQEGNRAVARKLSVNESVVRQWEEFMWCQSREKLSEDKKAGGLYPL